MFHQLSKFALATAGFGWGLSAISLAPAQAAIANFSLEGMVVTGELIGAPYSGSFSFDNSPLAGVGDESLPLSSLTFTFLDSTFGLGDASVPPVAVFFDGEFLGVEYQVIATQPAFDAEQFALTAGLFDLSEAAFTYTPREGDGGQGTLTYQAEEEVARVPEPSSVLGLLALASLASASALKHRNYRNSEFGKERAGSVSP